MSIPSTRVPRPGPTRAGSPAYAAPSAALALHQVHGAEQHDRSGQRGDPGGEVEEALQAVDVEELGGQPAAEQRAGDADQRGDDDAVRLAAADETFGDGAGDDSQHDPGDDAHEDSQAR